jgi:hypothetical protein
MADFLSRLVARSRGTAPVVRPVVAPLFAGGPQMGVDGLDSAAATDIAAGDRRVRFEPWRHGEPLTRSASEDFDARGRNASAERRTLEHEPTAPSSEREDPPARVDAPVRTLAPLAQAPAQPAADRVVHGSDDAPALRDSRARAMPAVTLPRRDRARRIAVASAAERDESAPVVQVSIGRIEVRAVTAPASPPAKRAPSPPDTRLSLEEYLRNGKTRP